MFKQETYSEVIDEIKPLLMKHWEEVALNKDKVKLDPDWSIYQYLESKGMMNITTVRDNNVLKGYVIYFLSKNPHYKSQLVAECDIFYLDPEYRNNGLGKQLFLESEKNLVELGVNKVINRVKMHLATGEIFEHIGYKAIEKVYSKLIG